MTKDEKISNFERVLSWLPEAFKRWATSNPFLSSTLNEVLNERDTRLSGTPCTSRLKTAMTALLQKLQDRRDKNAALILSPSRESEETAFALASRMSAGTGLKITATTGIRDAAGLTSIFAEAPDLVVTNPKVLEKVFDKGFASPDSFRTILVDGAEWHDVMGDTDRIAALVERFPAARQLIVTGPVAVETSEDPYNAMMHAPAYCRAPDEAPRESAPKERVILVPEDKMSEVLAREAERTPVLYLVSSPTESTRITGLLKDAGIAAKRASATQSASARETLVLKFIAGRIEHLVMPHSVIGELEHNRAEHIVLTDLSGGPEPYLEHLALAADGAGELVAIVTPETLPLFEKLLVAAEKRLTLENPYNLPEPRTVIGQLLRREKLTIRTNYGRASEAAEPDDADGHNDRSDGRGRRERRKPHDHKAKNNPRKDRKEGFHKDRKDFKKDSGAKNFSKKPRKAFKSSQDEMPAVSGPQAESDAVDLHAAPMEGASAEQGPASKPRKTFKERRFSKNRAVKQAQVAAVETAVSTQQTSNETKLVAAPISELQEGAADDSVQNKPRNKGYSKNYRRKQRRSQNVEGEGRSVQSPDKAVQSIPAETTAQDDRQSQEKKTFEKKRFQKKPKKAPVLSKPREQEWDDDNFGNSIHYQPKRQNLRGLRSDQTIHWEPTDPYHPSSQALSLPQIMPDENRRNYVNGNVNGNVKNGFPRNRKNYRKKREG